jgi:segregation and condensation protein A
LFELLSAFRDVLARTDQETVHEVTRDSFSIQERIHHVLERLQECGGLSFDALFSSMPRRGELVATFLALLELVRLQLVSILQEKEFGPIWISPAAGRNLETDIPFP